jgi:hypothetical protein
MGKGTDSNVRAEVRVRATLPRRITKIAYNKKLNHGSKKSKG